MVVMSQGMRNFKEMDEYCQRSCNAAAERPPMVEI